MTIWSSFANDGSARSKMRGLLDIFHLPSVEFLDCTKRCLD